ncbi:Protease II (PtrB) (PDB:4BP9) [Commensalibacter communis]|uniref:S9 family peptidase n=1 Tax=Commensalibacter communis TaxID=2972786 RepID=UPI0022FF9075|nr:S9 family peptidase [Commensalibacter communis]CAI3925828.1 Protease II (PtrB) (PDB:4BP9) [Commensalibacter communis]CAI3933302.1 Protease II (PtrB) (PDB:4BP9) [Commensalibacter communis]
MKPLLPPIASKQTIHIEQFGYQRSDNYAWIKDEHWQKLLQNPKSLRKDIESYLIAENNYTDTYLEPTKELQETLFHSMKNRLVDKDSSPELEDGNWIYLSRYEAGNEFKTYYRKSIQSLTEQTILDPNQEANKSSYYKVGYIEHSPTHEYLAYAEDTQGSEIWDIRINDLNSNILLPQTISHCAGQFTFSPCGDYLFWIYRDHHGRPTKIFRHEFASGKDTLIYEEHDPGFFLGIERSLSNQWIFITANDHDTNETWLLSNEDPTASPVCVMKRQVGIQYELVDWQGHFIIKTNLNDADNFKLMRMALPNPQQLSEHYLSSANWQEWITHDPETYLMETIAYQDFFVRLERHNVNTRIIITNKDGKEALLSGEEEAFVLSLDETLTDQTEWLRYSYQSPTTPRHWYQYNMRTGERKTLKIQEIPSGHQANHYETKRLWATASDGEQIPITITYRKDTPLNGKTPVLLYGYGSYGYAIDPTFSNTALNYLDQGWIYAIAHIRGGSEKGWNWFLQGRKFNKINSFTDFICCAEHLIQQNYTNAGLIIADGRSAGGMVMGYIANERPDLFAAIVAVVPFVDVLNTMSDISLPLTPPEWPEWGNPIEDKEAYEYIASYSPYDNIKKQSYPAILAIGGLTDPRVTYWEPTKWIAKLRDYNLSNAPLLLKINMDTGHGGTAGRYDSLKEAAFIQAFALFIVNQKI